MGAHSGEGGDKRGMKFVAANTFSHIPGAPVHFATNQKRGYATFPLPRSQHHQQQQQHAQGHVYYNYTATGLGGRGQKLEFNKDRSGGFVRAANRDWQPPCRQQYAIVSTTSIAS